MTANSRIHARLGYFKLVGSGPGTTDGFPDRLRNPPRAGLLYVGSGSPTEEARDNYLLSGASRGRRQQDARVERPSGYQSTDGFIVGSVTGKYAVLWSGGKDSALALYRARASGLEVTRLITFYESATARVRFHATRVEMIQAQAEALEVELALVGTSWSAMESRLLQELDSLRSEGFVGVVLGDIHLADVRAWYESRVVAAGLNHTEPLWGEPSIHLLTEYVLEAAPWSPA